MDIARPDPQELLRRVQREEERERRGRLKVFLGYASGVGKSLQMLDEGRRRHERGEDVVVAAIQPRSSAEVEALLAKLEIIHPLKIAGQEVIDVERLIQRQPAVVLIDGLAYDNPPGSRNPRRCDDVLEILKYGISVITSVNLQYIAEFQDEVERLTGKRAVQSVSKTFLEEAEEIVIVDAPAVSSDVGAPDEQQQQRLSKLREMALLLAAQVVDVQLREYLEANGIREVWGTQERFLVCLTPRSNALPMLQSGRRNADRFRGELFVAYIADGALSPEDQGALDRNFELARSYGAEVHVLSGGDPVQTLMNFARDKGITQIFMGHSLHSGLLRRFRATPVERLIEAADGIDVRIFPHLAHD